MSEQLQSIRIDRWLWHARFFKTRTLAAKIVAGGVRLNSTKVTKPAASVRPGDVLTFQQGNATRIVRVLALGERRGPAPEAQALYEDMSPPPPPKTDATIARGPAPNAREREAARNLKRGEG